MFKLLSMHRHFLPGRPSSPSSSFSSPLTSMPSTLSSLPPPSISGDERAPHNEASQNFAQSPAATSNTCSSQTHALHKLFHKKDGVPWSQGFSTAKSAFSHRLISGNSSQHQPTFINTISISEMEIELIPSTISVSWPSTVPPSGLGSAFISSGSLCTELSFENTTSVGEEKKEEVDDEPGIADQGLQEQVDTPTKETSDQKIGGAGQRFQSTGVLSPTIVIQEPLHDTLHPAKATENHPTTRQSIKRSLLGWIVKEPWTKFKKSGPVIGEDHCRVSQPTETTHSQYSDMQRPNSHVRNVPPLRPAQFPFPTRTTCEPHYVQWINGLPVPRTNTVTRLEEARKRECFHRRALKRLKSFGRFRRRPNMVPEMTEGRTTEPVEVVRIKRAYSQSRTDKTEGTTKETLLERVNRQRRAQLQEWRVTTFYSPQSTVRESSPVPIRVTTVVNIPFQGEAVESRSSKKKPISARSPSDRSTRKARDSTLAPKSQFASHWNEYKTKKLTILRKPSDLKRAYKEEEGQWDFSSKVQSPRQSSVSSQTPSLLRRPNSLTSYRTSIFSIQGARNQLEAEPELFAPAESIPQNRHPYVFRRSMASVLSSARSSLYVPPVARPLNRLSVLSTASHNSSVSRASSMANSIYSVLSMDWQHPLYFSRSRSHRCPPTLQDHARALPPYDQLTASITTASVLIAKSKPQMDATAEAVRLKGLQNPHRPLFELPPGHELHSTDIRITWQQVTEGFVEDDEDPVLAVSRPCLSAIPSAKDMLGFVEYGVDSDEVVEAAQGQKSHFDGAESTESQIEQSRMDQQFSGINNGRDLGGSSRLIFDVNDISAMVAAGIDPSEQHPNPMAFYHLHHPVENCVNMRPAVEVMETFNQNDFSESEAPAVDPICIQSFRSILAKSVRPIVTCFQKTRKSCVVQKWICKPLKNALHREESSQFTANEIRRTELGIDQARSNTKSSVCSIGWLHRIPGGPAAAGKFDRDWLDVGCAVRTRDAK